MVPQTQGRGAKMEAWLFMKAKKWCCIEEEVFWYRAETTHSHTKLHSRQQIISLLWHRKSSPFLLIIESGKKLVGSTQERLLWPWISRSMLRQTAHKTQFYIKKSYENKVVVFIDLENHPEAWKLLRWIERRSSNDRRRHNGNNFGIFMDWNCVASAVNG